VDKFVITRKTKQPLGARAWCVRLHHAWAPADDESSGAFPTGAASYFVAIVSDDGHLHTGCGSTLLEAVAEIQKGAPNLALPPELRLDGGGASGDAVAPPGER
jgi:hypothetical protein